MFAKRLLQKAIQHHHNPHQPSPQHNVQNKGVASSDFNFRIALHYGIPLTASILAFDPIQRLLAIGTLDGRIKVIGGGNIEGLLISPKKLPYKNLEFLCNQGFLVGVSNDNDIQVWDLEFRNLKCSLQWEYNITAFSVIRGTFLMYVGDEQGSISVLKFVAEEGKILQLPYHITLEALSEAAGISLPPHLSVVGILPQPLTSGSRLLIAYENGVIILWDVTDDKVVTLRGYSNLHLKNDEASESPSEENNEHQGSTSHNEQEEKEICSLCWASSSGSILAVGYTDGDILLWNVSSNSCTKSQEVGKSSNGVVKLQLSSGGRRLPVIILHWAPNIKSNNECGGQLFIYGGDEIGSEEVLTVLSLDWSSRVECLTCVDRMDLTLNGSFADMILIPKNGISESSSTDAVFVLTNPGQLHVYEGPLLCNLKFQGEKSSIKPENFPVVVSTIDPCITLAKHYLLPMDWNNLKDLLEKASSRAGVSSVLPAGKNWPVTGGVPSMLSSAEDTGFERIYVAGYQDGSVRIWDATNPILTLMYVLEGEVKGIEMAGGSSCVSALEFCSTTLSLAVGCESGLVRIYKIHESSKESMFHSLSETKLEVDVVRHKDNVHCIAVVFIVNSPIQTLHFACSGSRLAVGYKSGQVMMLEMNSLSILFNSDNFSGSISSEIISFTTKVFPNNLTNSPKQSSSDDPNDSVEEQEALFILTGDAHIAVIDSFTGNMIVPSAMHPKKECTAISMHIIGGASASEIENSEYLSKKKSSQNEHDAGNQPSGGKTGVEKHLRTEASCVGSLLPDSLLLLCCEDSLILYSLKSVVQGDDDYIHKVNLLKPCCWATTFKLKDEKAYGVILLYQTGVLEIRSLPGLEILEENSLMSILRWPFKVNMDKTLGASENGEISLVYGSELAFVSIFSSQNDFRIPESLPCLYDKVLAEAAAAAAVSVSNLQKKQQVSSSKVFGGIIKGFKGGKGEQIGNFTENISQLSFPQKLEKHFSRIPLKDPSVTFAVEDAELSIDDIEIDDPLPIASTSSHSEKHSWKDEKRQREKLFEGATIDAKPRPRTHEEILTKYKFGGDASAAAAYARDKLVQRQEKLQRINERTEELQNRAQDFKSMADELVKTMENRKWWKL